MKSGSRQNISLARKVEQLKQQCNDQLLNPNLVDIDSTLAQDLLAQTKLLLQDVNKQQTLQGSSNEKDESKKLEQMKISLTSLNDKLEALGTIDVEADYFRSVKSRDLSDNEEDKIDNVNEDSEDDEEDDDEYEEEIEEEEGEEEEEQDEDDYSDEESERTESLTSSTVNSIICEAVGNYSAQEAGDLSFEKGTKFSVKSQRRDGWWEAENLQSGVSGMVPSNFMRILCVEEIKTSGKMREELKNVKFEQLRALLVLHSGSRPSTFIQFLKDNNSYLLSTWLHPRLSATCISYKDLNWDLRHNKIVPVTSINRIITINILRNIPPPKANSQIVARRVHMAITTRMSGDKFFLSNIHTINCVWSAADPSTWKFLRNNGSWYYPKVICRIESSDANLGLLLEACCIIRNSETGELFEVCVAWTFLPLFQSNGIPVPNKTRTLPLYGGMPFESGVELDESWPLRKTFGRSAKPQINMSIATISRFKEPVISQLPSTILLSTLHIKTVALFRKACGQSLLKDSDNSENGVKFDSTLSLMLQMADQPVLMDLFKRLYTEKTKDLRRVDKKDLKFMKKFLDDLLKSTIWPMVAGSTPQLAHHPVSRTEINDQLNTAAGVATQGALSLFTKEGPHVPFDVSELTYVPIYKQYFVNL